MARNFTSEERKFLRCEGMPEHSLYSGYIVNNGATELDIKTLGLPLKASGNDWQVCLSGDEASATRFGVEFETYNVPAGERTQRKVTMIEHGPIVVSVEGLAKTDPAGTAYVAAALEAALAALPASKTRVDDNRDNLMAKTA